MTRAETIFSKNAVGVAFLDPEQTGPMHLSVNPDTGAIVLAEAHPIRLRGSGVKVETLSELGATASALVSEYISNYLSNGTRTGSSILPEDPTFRNLLGQTVSGLDQMLIDTVSSGNENMVAYQMGEATQTNQVPPKSSLLNKISNSLEAVVYYHGGIHISHRGESQQYLVGKRVQKLTQDHVSGGLFSKPGDLEDFIPQIHTNTLVMDKSDRLVMFSRDAALSSFPLNHLSHWLGDGDPTEQAQRVADELKKLGRQRGCVLVFAPDWNRSGSDDIVSNGMFSLVNLANLEKSANSVIPGLTTPPAEPEAEAAPDGAMSGAARASRTPSSINRAKKRPSVLKTKGRGATDSTLASWSSPDPFETRRPARRSVLEPDIQTITDNVMGQVLPHIDSIEEKLLNQLKSRLASVQKETTGKIANEISSAMDKRMEEELPALESSLQVQIQAQLQAQFEEEINQLEIRMSSMIGKNLATLRAHLNTVEHSVRQLTDTVSRQTAPPQPTGGLTNDSLKGLDAASVMYSSIPRAITASAQKPAPPVPAQVKQIPIRAVASQANTLPAAVPYETAPSARPTASPAEETAAQINHITTAAPESDGASDEFERISLIPDEESPSMFPDAPSRKKRTGRIVLITALVAIAALLIFLFATPYSPMRSILGGQKTPAPPAATALKASPAAAKPLPQSQQTDAATDNPSGSSTSPKSTADQNMAAASAAEPQTADVIAEAPPAASKYLMEPPSTANADTLYDKGMELYTIADAGRDGKKSLTNQEALDALKSALLHFEAFLGKDGARQPNAWYLKGRTEYNLTKTVDNPALRKAYAHDALKSYQRYGELQKSISKSKLKTIKRNQKRLKQILR